MTGSACPSACHSSWQACGQIGASVARFVPSARAEAELNGLPDYPFVVIGHPIANDGDEELRRKAEAVVTRIAALLTERPVAP